MRTILRIDSPTSRVGAFAALIAAALLAACGQEKDDKKPATQTAARVNKEEITVHQVNAVLATQRGLAPQQADAAGKQVLERLIDQELAVQKAVGQKIDRDPRVVSQIEAARREIISRAYFDKVGEGAPKPSADDVRKFYDENPALFSQRRIYQFQELAIESKPEQLESLRVRLKSAKNALEFVEYLRSQGLQVVANQAVRPAEQLPLAALPELSKMKDGETLLIPTPKGAQVVFLVASRSQAVDEQRARPAIEQFILNERKRKLIADDLKALRGSAAIQYRGKFAEGAPVAVPVAPAPTAAEVAASAAKALDEAAIRSGFGLKDSSGTAARPPASIAEPVSPSASAVDAATLKKGLGLK